MGFHVGKCTTMWDILLLSLPTSFWLKGNLCISASGWGYFPKTRSYFKVKPQSVDGSFEIPAETHQLRLVVFSYYLQGFIHPKVVVWDFRTINNMALYQGVMRSEAI